MNPQAWAMAAGENVLAFADENGPRGLVEWRPAKRWCGFNLLGMFISRRHAKPPAHDPKWSRTPGYFPEEDFRWMRDWGFNFARLPLDYRCWIKGNDWDAIDEDELRKLDAAVRLGQKHGIHVQLCLHRAPGYCINPPEEPKDLFRDRDAQRVFLKHWTTLAKRFRGISNDDLSFDLFNEPPWEISSWQPELHDRVCRMAIEDNLKIMRERGLGFCLWNLRGAFGVMDSGRTDIAYEDFEGHKLDRELLDLLRKYAQ